MKKTIMIIAVLCMTLSAAAQELVILHTNDTHSHIDPVRSGEQAGLGGVIERAAYIDSVRAAAGRRNVLLLDAGDFSQGSSYFSILKGDVEIDLLNAMKYDAVCLGNHEFDNGLEELARRLGNLKMPVVCANYDFSASVLGDLVEPYTIIRRGGYRIGIIGLITDLTRMVDRDIADKVTYLDPVEVTNKYAEMLKNDKQCDIVICLTHIGYSSDIELAAGTRNVDLIIGGHSHTFLEKAEYTDNIDGVPVPIVTDGCWGLEVGNIMMSRR